MIIRPKISKFQNGGTTPQWFLNLYKLHALTGWNNTLNKNYANQNLNINDHYNAGDLETVYNKNNIYTGTPAVVGLDIQSFYDSDGGNMTPEEFVKYYNENAEKIRSHWASDQTYNKHTAGDHNRLYRRMFKNRSNTSNEPGSAYNIGYLEGITKGGYDIQDIEGSSTWLRRMDRYEHEFDPNNPDANRIHEITLKNGSKAKVYKKANGDIGLLEVTEGNLPTGLNSPANPNENPNGNPNNPNGGRIPVGQGDWGEGNPLSKLGNLSIGKLAPAALNIGRLWNTLRTNKDVYRHMKKAIFPVLQLSYHTHRQVVGDEATKQAYYTRAAQGQTKAARPFTADADRQMAYLMEAKRIGDQLRAEGDLADNREIRRTSDESMQHAWQNQARDTLVANENTMAIAKAKAARHQLDAQEASARGTSWDNWLKELQYNIAKKNQEEIAYQNTLDLYDFAYSKLNDERRKSLQKAYEDAEIAYDKNKTRENYNKVNDALKALKSYDLNWQRQWYVNHPPRYATTWLGRRGGRFNYDHDAELLYKVSRDAVKHFREMSKLTDDSRIKTLPKAIKLKDPPRSRKYQYGGQAPFMVYTPLALGGVGDTTTASASSSTKSSGDKKDKHDTFDVVKDLFKEIAGKGLPSDVSVAYDLMSYLLRSVQANGGELDSDDLASMYLKQMQVVNNLQFEKAAYDKAKENVTNNKGLGEIAVDSSGKIIGLDENGDLKRLTLEELKDFKGKFKPFTNEQLLSYRAYSPNKAFDREILEIVGSGVGIEKVAEYIKAHINSIGTDEFQQEGYSKKEAELIMSGIQALQQASELGLAMAPDGTYKGEYFTKTQERLMLLAINYLKRILPENMKTVLAIHGGSVEQAISEAVVSRGSEVRHYSFDAVTGKAAKDANGSSSSSDLDKIKSNPLIAMIQGIGGDDIKYNIVTKDSNTQLSVDGKNYNSIPNVKSDMSIDKMLSESGIDSQTNKYGITFGDQQIDPANLKDIMYSNVGGAVVTLPCKIVNGVKQVNFDIIDLYEEAEKEALKVSNDRQSVEYQEALGKELIARHLDSLVDSNGYPNRNMVTQFLVVEGYTTDKNMKLPSSKYIEKLRNPDDALEKRLSEALSTDTKKTNYSIDIKDKWSMFEWGYDIVYRGSVFIPLSLNLNSAIFGWGKDNTFTLGESRELEKKNLIEAKRAQYNNDTTYN